MASEEEWGAETNDYEQPQNFSKEPVVTSVWSQLRNKGKKELGQYNSNDENYKDRSDSSEAPVSNNYNSRYRSDNKIENTTDSSFSTQSSGNSKGEYEGSNSYGGRNQTDNYSRGGRGSYSRGGRDGESYSRGGRDGDVNSYSRGGRDGNSYSRGGRDGDSYSRGGRDEENYPGGDRDGNGYSRGDRDADNYSSAGRGNYSRGGRYADNYSSAGRGNYSRGGRDEENYSRGGRDAENYSRGGRDAENYSRGGRDADNYSRSDKNDYRSSYTGQMSNQEGDFAKVFGEEDDIYENKQDYFADSNRPAPITYAPEDIQDTEEALFNFRISEGIDFSKYQNIPVDVSGGGDVNLLPKESFADFNLHGSILRNVERAGYHTPTPVQKLGIPAVINTSNDVMSCAQTGSGKTAAFLLPIFTKMIEDGDIDGSPSKPILLVLGPTRELVSQIYTEMRKFAFGTGIKCCQIYGGVSRSFIMQGLSNGCQALSATPGRLIMLASRGEIDLESVKYVVLDEADRMLDMGFIPDVRKILQNFGIGAPGERRCFMFSATFPQSIQELASEFLSPDYLFITIGVVGGAADSILQKLECVKVFEKKKLLLDSLYEFEAGTKVLIFVETKRQADYITVYLCQSGINAVSIHGDRFQEQREEALRMFKRGECSILVATSVAARGLDVPEISVVINYDLPKSVDDYVHRIGRTGRIGNKGIAISFFQKDQDEPLAKGLINILENAGQEVPDWLYEMGGSGYSAPSSFGRQARDFRQNKGNGGNQYNASDVNPYKPTENTQSGPNNSAWNQCAEEEEEW